MASGKARAGDGLSTKRRGPQTEEGQGKLTSGSAWTEAAQSRGSTVESRSSAPELMKKGRCDVAAGERRRQTIGEGWQRQ